MFTWQQPQVSGLRTSPEGQRFRHFPWQLSEPGWQVVLVFFFTLITRFVRKNNPEPLLLLQPCNPAPTQCAVIVRRRVVVAEVNNQEMWVALVKSKHPSAFFSLL